MILPSTVTTWPFSKAVTESTSLISTLQTISVQTSPVSNFTSYLPRASVMERTYPVTSATFSSYLVFAATSLASYARASSLADTLGNGVAVGIGVAVGSGVGVDGGTGVVAGCAEVTELGASKDAVSLSESSLLVSKATATIKSANQTPQITAHHFNTFHSLRTMPIIKPTIVPTNAAITTTRLIIPKAIHITKAPSWLRIRRPLQRALPTATNQGRKNAAQIAVGCMGIRTANAIRCSLQRIQVIIDTLANSTLRYPKRAPSPVATPTPICHTAMRTNHVAARREG